METFVAVLCSMVMCVAVRMGAPDKGTDPARSRAEKRRWAQAVWSSDSSAVNIPQTPITLSGRGKERPVRSAASQHDESPTNHISSLSFVMTSPLSGHVRGGGCNTTNIAVCATDATYTVNVPQGHVTLISFPKFEMKWDYFSKGEGFVELCSVHANGTLAPVWRHASKRVIPPRVYNTPVLIRLLVPPGDALFEGFEMIFTLHPASQAPTQLRDGVFNCSVPFYHTFREHFHCNLVPQCPGGEDEGGHCPFSNEDCDGRVAVGSKCYVYRQTKEKVSWRRARKECQSQGGDLVTLKTSEEKDAFVQLLNIENVNDAVYVGLQSFHSSMPRYYSKSHVWVDGTVNYNFYTRYWMWRTFYGRICFVFNRNTVNDQLKAWLCYVPCNVIDHSHFVCQTEVKNVSKPSLNFPKGEESWDKQESKPSLRTCPEKHVTHTFLSCDPHSHCGTSHYIPQCKYFDESNSESSEPIPMFVCDDSVTTLHYTVVCDFREDCKDKADEEFCLHSFSCLDFVCGNGQCVHKSDECNGVIDCLDGTDEVCPHFLNKFQKMTIRLPHPTKISFLGDGTLIQKQILGCDSCLQTHMCCAEGSCLPVYCRCNGLGDCLNHEDEEDCEHFQCPGFYRCWSSSVCVHASHLCDGWPQCPKHDDEWLCRSSCPETCLCQGHAFRCFSSVHLAPSLPLKYLDAAGSGMSLQDVSHLMYLIRLSLSRCGIKEIPQTNVPNLLSLDLSYNDLVSVNMDVFLSLTNLRELDLSSNPLEGLFNELSDIKHSHLLSVDLSGSLLTVFNSTVLVNYPTLQHLNLSHSALTDISKDGFGSVPNLESVDLRGNNIRHYPSDVFRPLYKLQSILSEQYKLCCKDLLPQDFDESNCFAPKDEISSCADLLRSDTYRTFLWLFSVLSISGNLGCLLTRVFFLKGKSVTAFSIFVNNLSIADLVMGVYLGVVGAADHVYRGNYNWFEESWKPSKACQLAGFLSLLSSETSALIICLITLDRFLVLRFPFSQIHFRRCSATTACLVVWLVGFSLASVPILPITLQWRFYSQTGICIPLPITRKNFKGRDYAFGIMIIFNLVLFMLIASGQVMIYWTIRTTSAVQSTGRKSKDLTVARRLLSVIVSDFLCWFPIGLLGVLAANGTPIPGEVNVGMAIFVLPLNAALNPFLYTFNALMEIWTKKEEDRLLKQLDTRCL